MKTNFIALFAFVCFIDLSLCQVQVPDPNIFCFECLDRRNDKDLYGDPSNCHWYFQCFYFNDSTAIGIRRPCPKGQFWHDDILSCMPEGQTPCHDPCQTDEIAAATCYGSPTNCATFFVCSNGASNQFCCPGKTTFNPATCTCTSSRVCNDVCQVPSSDVQPTRPPPRSNGTICEDSYGTLLQPVPDHPEKFAIVDLTNAANPRITKTNCAPGTTFSLNTCDCSGTGGPINSAPTSRLCDLYLPFDNDYADKSVNHFATDPYGFTQIDRANKAIGAGSLYVKNGRVEIAGLKNIDFKKKASFCLFFRCDAIGVSGPTSEPYDCLVPGGLLSNNGGNPNDYSVIMSANSNPATKARVDAQVRFQAPIGISQLSYPPNAFKGFNQVCLIYDGSSVQLFINGASPQPCLECVQTNNKGDLAISHCPYTIGTDYTFGNFTGNIDEVLVCPVALTPAEVNAHYRGDVAYLASQGLLPA